MCHFKIINRTSNGFLLFCPKKNLYNVSFNNLTFNFDPSEMFSFISFLDKIDTSYWEKEYENSIYNKKIPIPTLQKNFIILIDRYELFELLSLLDFDTKNKGFLTYKDFENKIHFN